MIRGAALCVDRLDSSERRGELLSGAHSSLVRSDHQRQQKAVPSGRNAALKQEDEKDLKPKSERQRHVVDGHAVDEQHREAACEADREPDGEAAICEWTRQPGAASSEEGENQQVLQVRVVVERGRFLCIRPIVGIRNLNVVWLRASLREDNDLKHDANDCVHSDADQIGEAEQIARRTLDAEVMRRFGAAQEDACTHKQRTREQLESCIVQKSEIVATRLGR